MYFISIIMPIYNAEKYLDRTINSIINQTIGFENIELILVDDKSTDSSKSIIKEYASKYPNIKSFFSDKNHGFPGYGRNIGLKNANAEYIMFIDNDDEFEIDFCETVFDIIEKGGYDVVSTNFKIIKNSVIISEDIYSKISEYSLIEDNIKLIELNRYRNVTDSVIWTKIFKKSIIQSNDITFVENGLSEDRLFLFEYYYHANNIVLIDYYGYKHYKHGENLSHISPKTILNFINSYYIVLNLVEEKYGNIDKEDLFRDNIEVTLYCIILSSNQKCLLDKLYEFEMNIQFNSHLNKLWSNFCNKLLLKKRYSILLIFFKVLKIFIMIINFKRKIL